jgi:hypothetical protein
MAAKKDATDVAVQETETPVAAQETPVVEAKPAPKANEVDVTLTVDTPSESHTIHLKDAVIFFEKGVARVSSEIAKELRKLGIIK